MFMRSVSFEQSAEKTVKLFDRRQVQRGLDYNYSRVL